MNFQNVQFKNNMLAQQFGEPYIQQSIHDPRSHIKHKKQQKKIHISTNRSRLEQVSNQSTARLH